jgi:hypothetical protein
LSLLSIIDRRAYVRTRLERLSSANIETAMGNRRLTNHEPEPGPLRPTIVKSMFHPGCGAGQQSSTGEIS